MAGKEDVEKGSVADAQRRADDKTVTAALENERAASIAFGPVEPNYVTSMRSKSSQLESEIDD